VLSSTFQTILLLGGTGTFGQAMTRFLLDHTEATIRILSRGELLQSEMMATFDNHPRLRFMLGDIRDLARLNLACYDADLVVHAAALKHVDKSEYDPEEFIKTNIVGTMNVLSACRTMHVPRAVFISSDKQTAAVNLYGHTKAVAEKLWIHANGYQPEGLQTVVVRYANVTGSRGSVVPLWRQHLKVGQPLKVTSPLMTRFWMSITEAVQLVWFAAQYGPRGSVLVPHVPAYRLLDLLDAVQGECKKPFVLTGVRPGEKLHEELVSMTEGAMAYLYSHAPGMLDYYALPPVIASWPMPSWDTWKTPLGGTWEPFGFDAPYRSDSWPWRLSVQELRQRLEESRC
jgi:UDP-N-acetylglucosamine 4,6-dehydratase/5-epimerase